MYLAVYHEKIELEEKSMENLRTIRDLEQEVKSLQQKVASNSNIFSSATSLLPSQL